MKAKTIKICGHTYQIIDSSTDLYGETKIDQQTIAINPRLSPGLQEEVLIHEVLHTVLFHTHAVDQDDMETALNALANGLYRLGFRVPVDAS